MKRTDGARRNINRGMWMATTLAVTLSFQNCGGFRAPNFKFGQGLSQISSFDTYRAVSASELQPVTVELQTASFIPTPANLPEGAAYDASSKTLRWIPKKGQAGDHIVDLGTSEDGRRHALAFEVSGLSEASLKTGPPGSYRDEDVGYVFVHGAGEVDRCTDRQDLAEYWGSTVDIVAPNPALRTVVCYDGRKDVELSAPGVAEQIAKANCGPFNRCIVITHSMGGLMMNHVLTHTRAARAGDPKPELFARKDLYKQVKDKTLFVISLGSSAGGSKAANIAEEPEDYGIDQELFDFLTDLIGYGPNGYTRSNQVTYATTVLAPVTSDPEVPFFMVPGYSERQIRDDSGVLGGLFEQFFDEDEAIRVFNGDASLAILDEVVVFKSRSDGLVDFRSACGVASSNENDGPGHSAELSRHFEYCYRAPKKPNHYPWFASNVNHYLLSAPWSQCDDARNPCRHVFANPSSQSFSEDARFFKMNTAQVMRAKLTEIAGQLPTLPVVIEIDPQSAQMASVSEPRN